jgi:hypothetical protein
VARRRRPRPRRARAAGRVCVAWFDAEAEEHRPTASLERLRERRDRAEAAESLRLLYVALTRARDHLVLSGAGADPAGGWARQVLDVPEALLRRVPAGAAAGPDGANGAAEVPRPVEPGAAAGGGEREGAEGAGPPGAAPVRLRPPPPAPELRIAVTALAEYARCPRRDWWGRHLGLPEPRGVRGEDDPERATERGSLVHALLAEVDLAAGPLERRALLAAAAARRGRDPAAPATRRVLRDVEQVLAGEAGRRLSAWARAGALAREVPFVLRVGPPGGPACRLDGAIDALAEERDGLRVIDFKYAAPRPGAAAAYRLQLAAYALAAGRARPGSRVRAELWFLRAPGAVVDVTPAPADLARLEAGAPGWARGALSGAGRDLSPAALGRDEARCRAEGCGWASRCFAPPGARPPPPVRDSGDGAKTPARAAAGVDSGPILDPDNPSGRRP